MEEFDVLILADSGIGNAIQALYPLEYCLANNVRVGIYLNRVNNSFQNYLKDCYGGHVVLSTLENCKTKYLIQSFTFQEKITLPYQYYFYIQNDNHSSKVMSEIEQYLSVVQALFPSEIQNRSLPGLKADFSPMVKALAIEDKYVLYPGGSSVHSARRWPHYRELIELLGENKWVIVGGKDDTNFAYSYIYPAFLGRVLPQKLLNSKNLWTALKNMHILKPYAHFNDLGERRNAYIEKFSWGELVAIFKSCKQFIGNDGGLMHLAAAAGSNGLVLFGPSSALKNKPYNLNVRPVYRNYPCQPCQFGVGRVKLVPYYMNCPYGIRCLESIPASEIFNMLND